MSIEWRGNVDVDFCALDAVTSLDPSRLSFFRQYLTQQYSGPFIHGMGSYEILDMVRRFLPPGRRLDIGSGTASLFWMLAVSGNVLTTASDVEPEALAVLREFLAAPSPLPACYYQAAELFRIPAARVESLRQSIDSYLIFNALTIWPRDLTRSYYDSVTAFGCFAISGSEDSYQRCFQSAMLAVRPGGRIIGADWIRHRNLQTRDYSFVNVQALRRIGLNLELRVAHLEDIIISGDETYGGVVLWAFEKP
jgi:SAM-dependent methyltransferase